MPQHRLLPENGSSFEVWDLEWTDTLLTLTAPNGVRVIESPIELAHRLFDQHECFEEEKIRFQLPQGETTFPIRLDALGGWGRASRAPSLGWMLKAIMLN